MATAPVASKTYDDPCPNPSASSPCRIEVVDRESGWPVPLVELRTTHHHRFVTDNAGLIAIYSPELLERETFFNIIGHGYGVKKDGFGYEGVRLTPKPGETLRVEVDRRILAKRLGRLTGAGRFAESQRLGVANLPPETGVFGCDTIQATRHGDRLFWLWGDTTLSHYPLGVFESTAATTELNPLTRFEPPINLSYDLYRNKEGRARGIAPVPGEGPTWLDAMISVPDKDNKPRLVATYAKIRLPMDTYELGLCAWNEETQNFERHTALWKDGEPELKRVPRGHPVPWRDENGKDWILFGDPFPTLRCPATYEAWQNPETWESIELPPNPVTAEGESIQPHRGSIAWNSRRKSWLCIFTQRFGKPSELGEIWFTEAPSPTGPWSTCVKVLTHDNMTFYNPRIDRELTPPDADFIVFEGTYTSMFTDHAQPTPRYEYNQMLYRLDFSDLPKSAD